MKKFLNFLSLNMAIVQTAAYNPITPWKCIALFIVGLLIAGSSLAQPQAPDSIFKRSFSLAVRGHYGTFIANTPKLLYIQDRHSSLAELDLFSQTNGSKYWQQVAHYPELGFALWYGQSGASKYIGHLAAAVPYLNFHLHESAVVDFNLRLGFGVAWAQRVFNQQSNYQNLILGSHINACINGSVTAGFHILSRIGVDIGLSFIHLSNGSIKLPNLGLNVPMLTAGVRYDVVPAQKRIQKQLLPFNRRIYYYLYSFVAAKQSYPLKSAVYLVNVFNAEAMKAISRTGRIGAGINLTIDRANSMEVPYSPTFAFNRGPSHLQAALYVGYEYAVGNLSFPLQIGYYLYNEYPINVIYQTIGVKYRFAAHWSGGLALKAHLGNGDLVQWGLGYRF